MSSAFVAELARSLQGQSPSMALSLAWVEQRLSEDGATIEQRVQEENQSQAADQVSIGNSINSLRFLGAMDWREFVETSSAMEQILRTDPADIYAQMDFNTRDGYRHVIDPSPGKVFFRKRRLPERPSNWPDPQCLVIRATPRAACGVLSGGQRANPIGTGCENAVFPSEDHDPDRQAFCLLFLRIIDNHRDPVCGRVDFGDGTFSRDRSYEPDYPFGPRVFSRQPFCRRLD